MRRPARLALATESAAAGAGCPASRPCERAAPPSRRRTLRAQTPTRAAPTRRARHGRAGVARRAWRTTSWRRPPPPPRISLFATCPRPQRCSAPRPRADLLRSRRAHRRRRAMKRSAEDEAPAPGMAASSVAASACPLPTPFRLPCPRSCARSLHPADPAHPASACRSAREEAAVDGRFVAQPVSDQSCQWSWRSPRGRRASSGTAAAAAAAAASTCA
eukprot:scaffold651_cov79-Isochrysis_galbana.AAC.3